MFKNMPITAKMRAAKNPTQFSLALADALTVSPDGDLDALMATAYAHKGDDREIRMITLGVSFAMGDRAREHVKTLVAGMGERPAHGAACLARSIRVANDWWILPRRRGETVLSNIANALENYALDEIEKAMGESAFDAWLDEGIARHEGMRLEDANRAFANEIVADCEKLGI